MRESIEEQSKYKVVYKAPPIDSFPLIKQAIPTLYTRSEAKKLTKITINEQFDKFRMASMFNVQRLGNP